MRAVGKIVGTVVDFIVGLFETCLGALAEPFESLVGIVRSVFRTIRGIVEGAVEFITGLLDGISDVIGGVVDVPGHRRPLGAGWRDRRPIARRWRRRRDIGSGRRRRVVRRPPLASWRRRRRRNQHPWRRRSRRHRAPGRAPTRATWHANRPRVDAGYQRPAAMIPTAEVAFAATDETCSVERAVIRHGRDDPSSQPQTDTATLEIVGVVPAGTDIGTDIAVDAIVAGVRYRRFAGQISDIAIAFESVDRPVATIIAVGQLAAMGRRIIGDEPWPVELDGARANRAIALAGVPTDPVRTDPGTVQVLARDVDAQPALNVAQDAAVDGDGMLWMAKDGVVLYADVRHRRGYAVALALDACSIPLSIVWSKGLEGLANDIRIRYGAEGAEAEVHLADDDSVAELGEYGASLSTRLANASAANARATLLLNRQSRPAWILAGIGVDLGLIGAMRELTPAADAADTVAILGLEVHNLVSVTGLPDGSPAASATLWIEGWTETIAFGSWLIEYAVSDYCRSSTPPAWDDIPLDRTWNNVDPARTWDAIYCLPPTPPAGRWNDVPSSLRWNQVPPATTWNSWT